MQTAEVARRRDMAQGALTQVHEESVAPVGAGREVGGIVVAGVEEEALFAGCEAARGEGGADDSHEQMALDDSILALVGPVIFFPAPC